MKWFSVIVCAELVFATRTTYPLVGVGFGFRLCVLLSVVGL